MENKLLYYPYINIPKTGWTTRSILYWEKVGAIVPQAYKNNPNNLNEYMHELVQEGLVEQIFPYEHIRHYDDFDHSFLRLVVQPKFDLKKRIESFLNGNVIELHIQKVGSGIMNELCRMGIAKKKDYEWYNLEERTARLFMVYLASILAKANGYTPGTDKVSNIDFSLSQKTRYYLYSTRGKLLKDLMPYPLESNPAKLSMFKEKHQKQLRHFRIILEKTIFDITGEKDKARREYLYQMRLDEINYHREEIFARLTESKMGQILFGSLFGLAASGLSFIKENNLEGFFSLGNAIYSALQGYDRSDILSKDYAYLALIDRDLKIN